MSGDDGNKKYRDSVFCSYFNNNERLLSLCNAILDTNYKDADKLEINTLEGIFFDEQRNDISCTIEDHFLVLIEYQTTINENMPFRCLSYVVEILNKLVTDKNKLYRHPLITFPSPRFIVLYDGDAKEPLEREMRLSDAFWGSHSPLELIVKSYNINYNFEQELLQKCDYLKDYSILVFKVKEGLAAGLTRRKAISKAVKDCIANGIMKGYLDKALQVWALLLLTANLQSVTKLIRRALATILLQKLWSKQFTQKLLKALKLLSLTMAIMNCKVPQVRALPMKTTYL